MFSVPLSVCDSVSIETQCVNHAGLRLILTLLTSASHVLRLETHATIPSLNGILFYLKLLSLNRLQVCVHSQY